MKKTVKEIKEISNCIGCGKNNSVTYCSECIENLKTNFENSINENIQLKATNENLNKKISLIKSVLIKNQESVKESVKTTQQQYFILIGKESCLTEVINLIDNN